VGQKSICYLGGAVGLKEVREMVSRGAESESFCRSKEVWGGLGEEVRPVGPFGRYNSLGEGPSSAHHIVPVEGEWVLAGSFGHGVVLPSEGGEVLGPQWF